MTDIEATEAEVKALIGEAIGSLETISQGVGPLNKRAVRDALHEASLRIQRARLLADRLP